MGARFFFLLGLVMLFGGGSLVAFLSACGNGTDSSKGGRQNHDRAGDDWVLDDGEESHLGQIFPPRVFPLEELPEVWYLPYQNLEAVLRDCGFSSFMHPLRRTQFWRVVIGHGTRLPVSINGSFSPPTDLGPLLIAGKDNDLRGEAFFFPGQVEETNCKLWISRASFLIVHVMDAEGNPIRSLPVEVSEGGEEWFSPRDFEPYLGIGTNNTNLDGDARLPIGESERVLLGQAGPLDKHLQELRRNLSPPFLGDVDLLDDPECISVPIVGKPAPSFPLNSLVVKGNKCSISLDGAVKVGVTCKVPNDRAFMDGLLLLRWRDLVTGQPNEATIPVDLVSGVDRHFFAADSLEITVELLTDRGQSVYSFRKTVDACQAINSLDIHFP